MYNSTRSEVWVDCDHYAVQQLMVTFIVDNLYCFILMKEK